MVRTLNEQFNKQGEEISDIKAKMDRAVVVAKPDKDPNNFNLVNNNNVLNNNVLNVNIENFKDTKDFLTNDRKYYLLQRGMNALPYLVKDVNFNPERPENHNMYISNIKTKTAQVKENGQWVKRDARILVNDIIYDYDCRYFRGFAENPDPDIDREYPKATKYYYEYVDITDNKEAQKKIQNEIIEMMYNNREMIMETRRKEEAAIKQRKLLEKQQKKSG
jgi:hypothetical protein